MKKIAICRLVVQCVFLGLVFAGLYGNIRIALMALVPLTLVFGNFFCGWVCPFGAIQDMCSRFGSLFIKKKLKMPVRIQKYLQFFKLLIIAVSFTGLVAEVFSMIDGYKIFFSFVISDYAFSTITVFVIIYLVVAIFFERPYCNYLCVESFKHVMLNPIRFFTIKRNEETCVNCGKCNKVCPMNIQVSKCKNSIHYNCINCMKCISSCPKEKTLTYGFRFKKKKAQ